VINFLQKNWAALSNIGVLPEHDFEKAKRIRIINKFSIIGIYIALSYTFFLLLLSEPYLALLDFAIAVIGTAVIFIQKKRHYKTAALFMFISIPLILLAIDIAYDKAGAYFYFFSMFILAYYIFPKKKYLAPILLYLIFMFGFSISSHYSLGVEPSKIAKNLAPYFFYLNLIFAFIIASIFLHIFADEHINNQKKLETSIEETLKHSTRVKTLLKELSHRTKNNLQFISSMLNIQSKQTNDSLLKQKCQDIRNRINAIALVHKNLYLSQIDSHVNMQFYIQELLDTLLDFATDEHKNIEVKTDIDDFYVDMDVAVTLGLILNELISNALKHGLKKVDNKKLILKIKLSNSNVIEGYVFDNGSGIQVLNENKNPSFGIEIVKDLLTNKKDTIKFWEDQGNHVFFKYNTKSYEKDINN